MPLSVYALYNNKLYRIRLSLTRSLSVIRMLYGLLMITLLLCSLAVTAQFQLSGTVVRQTGESIVGAHIFLHEKNQVSLSDIHGNFRFEALSPGEYRLHVSYLGHECIHPYKVQIEDADKEIVVRMVPADIRLDEVIVSDAMGGNDFRSRPDAVVAVGLDMIEAQRDHSLSKTLESLPGLQAMEIGQGASKPFIRGLGFNRVVVTENNIKVEGQQWGADHGLEIDQFAAERLQVIKGPSALKYGSEAIGGVLRIEPHTLAEPNTLESEVQLMARSVNELLAGSFRLRMRKQYYFNYVRYSMSDFGMYKVPARSFTYNTYIFPIEDGLIVNSGGHERNLYMTHGMLKPWGKLSLSVSNVNAKMGFFSGAHGMPSLEALESASLQRKPELPFQQVNHLKVSTHAQLKFGETQLEADLAFQQNHRQEHAEFHTHYPNQTPPDKNSSLELEWHLNTFSADVKAKRDLGQLAAHAGISMQHQQNNIGGYAFLLPKYDRTLSGVFVHVQNTTHERIRFSAGLRYDIGLVQISPYTSPYIGIEKAPDYQGLFHDFSWAAGLIYMVNQKAAWKANLAKSFRVPTVAELGSNGMHHGSFQYELGSTGLNSEEAYQLDLAYTYETEKMNVNVGPFFGYFPNFIFLNPSGSYTLPDGSAVAEAGAGQVYQYVQSEAYRFGGELLLDYAFNAAISTRLVGEYVFASDGTYPLPLTPPATALIQLSYKLPMYWKRLHKSELILETRMAAAQNRHARNEEPTGGYNLLNLHFSTKFIAGNQPLSLHFRAQNLLNVKYLNHLSYYRRIGLPEAGRNFQLSIKIPLKVQLDP